MGSSTSEMNMHRPPDIFPKPWDENRRDDWALLILNQPISNIALLRSCMRICKYRICADGGANRLLEAMKYQQSWQGEIGAGSGREDLPDLVHGDLDSLRDDVRHYYTNRGVTVSLDEDQYSTDFQKSMKKIHEHAQHDGAKTEPECEDSQSQSTTSVLIFGTISGRVDQGLGLLSEMIREHRQHPEFKLYLISDSSFSFLLPIGENVIDFSGESGKERFVEGLFTRNVGIVPIAGPAVISTQGLEYDVDEWETNMGGQVSTSNHLIKNVIRIRTNELVLFTVELA